MRTIPFSSSSNFGSLRLQSKFSLFKKLAKKHNKQDATGDIEKTVGRKRYISVKGGGRGGWEERRVAARGRHERESDRERARDHPSSLWTNEMDQPAAGRQYSGQWDPRVSTGQRERPREGERERMLGSLWLERYTPAKG